MTFLKHISVARAAAVVHGPDIIVQMVCASYARNSGERIECLNDALSSAKEIVQDIEAALAVEMQPATPAEAAQRCLSVVEGSKP